MQFFHRVRRKIENFTFKYAVVEDEEYFILPSHTLSKADKKKHALHTGTMKPMSAHDEKTLDTAVAMANEITSKSMNDLGGEHKQPKSPADRSKFHFKFPQLSLHHNAPHEPEKDTIGKQEHRNFSEEANSVPDIQSTITEESKLAYTSLIEQPMCSSAMSHMAPHAATIPKPAPRAEARGFHSLQKQLSYNDRMPSTGDPGHQSAANGKNVLPLPPRNTKLKLVDKPRHIRKYPLKLPSSPAPGVPTARPIIYQNACPQLAPPTTSALPAKPLHQTSSTNSNFSHQSTLLTSTNGVDVCDGKEIKATNPFTSETNPANPFNYYLKDIDCGLDMVYADGNDGEIKPEGAVEGLVKDCSDHVSVEDLLEFADQKPCGRQRGVESDEVRIMSKVLKEQVTSDECLQALELSDWNVHQAIKMVNVKVSAEADVTLQECSAELSAADGDIVKASAALLLKRKEIKQ